MGFFIASDQCVLVHFNLPYKWEVYDGKDWRDLRNMEEIEKAYCDPKNEHRSVQIHMQESFLKTVY